MLSLQIQPFPLRGHSRHPGDFWSQGILVIHSRAPDARALAPRRSLALSTEPPVRSASLQSWWGKPPSLRGPPRGAPCPFPDLTATSMILLDVSTCTHMSEKTCARTTQRYVKPHMNTRKAHLHTQELASQPGCLPRVPPAPSLTSQSLLCSLHPPLDPHLLALLVLTLAGAFLKALVAVLAENVPVLFKEILCFIKDILDLFQQLEGCLMESSYTGLERQ